MAILIKNMDYYLHTNYNLPRTISGTVSPSVSDNAYNIVINGKLCREAQLHAFYHEIAHILCGHVDDPNVNMNDPAVEAEAEAAIPDAMNAVEPDAFCIT